MENMMKELDGKKTYLVALATFLYALIGMYLGKMDASVGIPMILASLGVGGLRSALKKVEM